MAATGTETGSQKLCLRYNDAQSLSHSLSHEMSQCAILCFALSVLMVQVGGQAMPSGMRGAGLGGDLEHCGNAGEGSQPSLVGWGRAAREGFLEKVRATWELTPTGVPQAKGRKGPPGRGDSTGKD